MPPKRKTKAKAKAKEHINFEDVGDDTPPTIEPYAVLGLEKSATADEIKSAYRKSALKHHPDKAPAEGKDEAHSKFQEIAFAYAVLSNPIRRKRYDTTGSTSESIIIDGDFSWADFYREQFKGVVTSDSIKQFANEYKNSKEERNDLLEAYTKYHGNWDGIYESVMLSDPAEDEDRFRAIIDEAIKTGTVKAYKIYTAETEKSKKRRLQSYNKERREAEELAKELNAEELLRPKSGHDDALKALIQKNQSRRGVFLEKLEAKYAALEKPVKEKKGIKRLSDDEGMPSEEAFLATQKGMEDGGLKRAMKKAKR